MVRILGDRTGTEQRYVKVSEIHPSYQLGKVKRDWNENTLPEYSQKAVKKYRKQYRSKKEKGWDTLPLITTWEGRLVVTDGTHRFMSAQMEGATEILCDVEI